MNNNGGVYAWLTTSDSVTTLHIAGEGEVIVSDAEFLFSRYANCKEIIGLNNLNTSRIKNMNYMFGDPFQPNLCNLTTLDVSALDTSNVTNMATAFARCTGLTQLDLSNWNTDNVTNMSSMFKECTSLTQLNLSDWNTDNVTAMLSMFEGCTNLVQLDLINFNMSAATDMYNMFKNCSSLTSIPSGLDLSKTNITSNTSTSSGFARMFYGCSSLTSARINSKYIGYQMFYGCNNLTNITIASDVQGVYANSDCFKYTGSGTLETKVLSFSSAMSDYEWTTDNRSLVTPDTLAPLGTISLGSTYVEVNGYMYVNSNTVTINLTASDDVTATSDIEVALINEDNYDKTKSNSSIVWQGFSPSVQWTTSSGGGLKYVYVIFKDEAGNQSVYFTS